MSEYTIEDFQLGDKIQAVKSLPDLKYHVVGLLAREASEDGEDTLVVKCENTGNLYNINPRQVYGFFN